MTDTVTPTERELDILKVLWDHEEATVREVYEALRPRLAIAQNTVQAFLRTMEEKGLVRHRLEGRMFIYEPIFRRQQTTQQLAGQLLQRAFDGAMDQLVQSVLSLRRPTADELARLEQLIAEAKAKRKSSHQKESAP
ncbi:MAG TPA: BlaI/MecI/CopY family transcriptional regulator [Pirellulales bacterium]|nr:BlaI/MecI/CopY family transcriptional regulator [Pirellulales bacterium]